MHSFGVDSLLAVELRDWVAKDTGANVALFDNLNSEECWVIDRRTKHVSRGVRIGRIWNFLNK